MSRVLWRLLINSWISSITFFILYVFSMFFGRYFDSHGPLHLLIAGTVVQVGAMIGIACEAFRIGMTC